MSALAGSNLMYIVYFLSIFYFFWDFNRDKHDLSQLV
jgi:hypothetical protein